MRKKYLLIGSLVFTHFFTNAQHLIDTLPAKKSRTDIDLLYNYYLQDGNHSAVTGGQGSEKLTVHGPLLNVKSTIGLNAIKFKLGADVITSASTDKIDYAVSSASIQDTRAYGEARYERSFAKGNWQLGGGMGFSTESDYMSFAGFLSFAKTSKNKMQNWLAELQVYNDDLRWGRTNPRHLRPVKLIYPEELRYKNWFTTTTRRSVNIKTGFTQIINKRNIIGIFPEFSYQRGLLSTPFHRTYFSNFVVAVENLPMERYKGVLGLSWNVFAGGRVILKNSVDGYADNFGILSMAIENETAVKITPAIVMAIRGRFYIQKASTYFAPFLSHAPGVQFFTSDYDLSGFKSYDGGVSLKYAPHTQWRRFMFDDVTLRYTYYYRSDGLNAHIMSVVTSFGFVHKQKKKPAGGLPQK